MVVVAVFCRHRVTAHLKQDCTVGCNWWRGGNEKSEIESHSSPLCCSDVGLSPRLLHHRQGTVLSRPFCLFRSQFSCHALFIWTPPPHLLIFTISCCISHLFLCSCLCSAMYEKVLTCWPRPQEVSFPLKHNHPTVKTRPSYWWPRNTSKWHGKFKKDWTEFMNFNSNPNSYFSSYSYLQAIFTLFSLPSAEPVLLSWRRNKKNSDRKVLIYDSWWFFIISLPF